jgi:hypothetical protein
MNPLFGCLIFVWTTQALHRDRGRPARILFLARSAAIFNAGGTPAVPVKRLRGHSWIVVGFGFSGEAVG